MAFGMIPESVRKWAYWSSVRAENHQIRIVDSGWTCTLVDELSETVVVQDEVIEPLLDLLGIPEESFALCEGVILFLHAVEDSFKPPESEFEREFRSYRWRFLRRRWLLRWHEFFRRCWVRA